MKFIVQSRYRRRMRTVMDNRSSSFLFYFVRSGYINLGIGILRLTGSHGNSWSSRDESTTFAYVLNFNVTSILTSAGPTEHSHGASLRCLSSVLGM